MENNIEIMSLNYSKIQINNQRQLLINKFIKMFPKVKLETILEINKFYNINSVNKTSINDIIDDYLNKKYIY